MHCYRFNFIKPSKLYSEIGQFDFKGEPYRGRYREKMDISKTATGVKYFYIGQFKEGTEEREGIGITVGNNGTIHEGYYRNDLCNGLGRVMYSGGSYYTGELVDGWANGYCEHHQIDGSLYKGNMLQGYKHGMGTLIKPDGTQISGEWRNGIFIG